MSKKIAVIGECMIELSEKGADVKRGFGGDTLNTSVYIARQVDPAALTVHYVTALGTDSFSQQMLDAWHGENVDTSLTQRMENRLPGLYYIETDSTGERTFYYWRNEAAAKFWLESEQSAAICEELANFDYLYLSGISLALLSPTSREKLLSLRGAKHVFTHVEWHMSGFEVTLAEKPAGLTFVTPQALRESYALPSAFRAFLSVLEE